MADNSYRSDRGRDPLAELARLIGQGDASSGGQSRETVDPPRPRAPAARDVDWAPEDRYAAPEPDTDTRYAAPLPSAPSYPSSSSDYYAPQQAQDPGYRDRGYQDPGYQDAGYQEQGHQGQGYRDQGYQDQGLSRPSLSRPSLSRPRPIKTKALKIAAITIKAMSSQREAASFPGRPASSTAFAKSRATACRISMTRRCRNCRRPATSLPMLPRRTRTAIELTSTTTPRTRPRLPITTIRKRATPAAGRLWLP